MIGIGIVGIGFMGVTHFRAIDNVRGARVTAICTRDRRKLKGDW
ncbi:MAG TPA: gfo/Idh/MocA family oxidoreductase, partial [Candidatus Latescibacteria bacterium]|nr:gfo/Idh/MocA family oxidoreductase [Candidatus Latescibacterota bacterium]